MEVLSLYDQISLEGYHKRNGKIDRAFYSFYFFTFVLFNVGTAGSCSPLLSVVSLLQEILKCYFGRLWSFFSMHLQLKKFLGGMLSSALHVAQDSTIIFPQQMGPSISLISSSIIPSYVTNPAHNGESSFFGQGNCPVLGTMGEGEGDNKVNRNHSTSETPVHSRGTDAINNFMTKFTFSQEGGTSYLKNSGHIGRTDTAYVAH